MDNQNATVFHSMKEESAGGVKIIFLFVFVVILGILSGYFLSKTKPLVPSGQTTTTANSSVAKGAVFGSNDTSTFKDTATGVVQAGGIDGEGQYHLVRPGGDSQNVYMTSSTVDLSQFVGKKVKVNGQTQSAQKAGWLMDVGRVEVVE